MDLLLESLGARGGESRDRAGGRGGFDAQFGGGEYPFDREVRFFLFTRGRRKTEARERRSNCAFVNYLTEAHLEHAIRVCTGLLLRPLDRRCKPLLCRVRMREDDAKSGVGAQRGSGMHKAYVEAMGRVEVEGREEENGKEEENGSEEGSTASTASSLFARHFPKVRFGWREGRRVLMPRVGAEVLYPQGVYGSAGCR